MEEEVLTLKTIQSHIIKATIKATITSAVSACGAAILLFVGFYYNTENRLSTNETSIKSITIVQEKQSVDINVIKEKMSADNANSSNLDKRLTAIEDSQKEIYRVLIEMVQNQKRAEH